MFRPEHHFLYDSLDSKQPSTARKSHIRRLFDIFYLCIQRNDIPRAQRAWAILIRCKEVDWKAMWRMGILLLGVTADDEHNVESTRLEFLGVVMRQYPQERESIIKETILRLINAGNYRKALDELELYLPSFPFQDNPVLHVYAGMLSLHLAQPGVVVSHQNTGNQTTWSNALLRDAQAHFERATILDPENTVANAMLDKLPTISQPERDRLTPESDDGNMSNMEGEGQRRKRIRS